FNYFLEPQRNLCFNMSHQNFLLIIFKKIILKRSVSALFIDVHNLGSVALRYARLVKLLVFTGDFFKTAGMKTQLCCVIFNQFFALFCIYQQTAYALVSVKFRMIAVKQLRVLLFNSPKIADC